jgi:hypothetical protein
MYWKCIFEGTYLADISMIETQFLCLDDVYPPLKISLNLTRLIILDNSSLACLMRKYLLTIEILVYLIQMGIEMKLMNVDPEHKMI